MALYKYFSKKESVLPTIHACRNSSLSKRDIDKANDCVTQVLDRTYVRGRGRPWHIAPRAACPNAGTAKLKNRQYLKIDISPNLMTAKFSRYTLDVNV